MSHEETEINFTLPKWHWQRPGGVTYRIIEFVRGNPISTANDIARELVIDPNTVTSICNRLRKARKLVPKLLTIVAYINESDGKRDYAARPAYSLGGGEDVKRPKRDKKEERRIKRVRRANRRTSSVFDLGIPQDQRGWRRVNLRPVEQNDPDIL